MNIPNSVTSIGDDAFRNCSNLTNVNIDNAATSIGSKAFFECNSLTNLTLGNAITTIGTSAFRGCSNLTSVTIPNSATIIGISAFQGCTGLTNVDIGNSVTKIDQHCFSGCSSLTSLTIGNSVTIINYGAFSGCSSLPSLTIPNSVKTIGHSAFSGCRSLTSLTIPNSVTKIYDSAFISCSNLSSVTIGNSVNSIGDWAFYGCSSLTSVTGLAETPPTANTNSFTNYSSATLNVPAGSLYEYQTTEPWKRFYNIQPIEQEYSISLNPTSAVIEKGDFIELKATVTPDDDYAPRVTWSSSNTSVATVDEWGTATAVGTGNAVITARAGNASATCSVRVVAHTVTLDKSSASIQLYSTLQLNATVTPHDGYEPTVEWSSSRPGVATVTQNGLVKGYMTGTAMITARAGQSIATCVVTVTPILATELTLNAYQAEIGVGEVFRLVATVYPELATNRTVSWTIPQNDVISYSCNGNECLFVGEKAGQATITARTTDGTNLSKSCVVTVRGSEPVFIPVQSISVSPSSVRMTVGATKQLMATVLPTNATNKAVRWTSSNTSVVTVTSNGQIKALRTGTATVSAHSTDGTGLSASCTVTVVSGGDPGDEVLPGDVNGDGEVNIGDVTALIDYLLGGDASGIDINAADCDQDGNVTISDVTALIDYLLGGQW